MSRCDVLHSEHLVQTAFAHATAAKGVPGRLAMICTRVDYTGCKEPIVLGAARAGTVKTKSVETAVHLSKARGTQCTQYTRVF